MKNMGTRFFKKYVIGMALLTFLLITACSTDSVIVENELVRDSGIREITSMVQTYTPIQALKMVQQVGQNAQLEQLKSYLVQTM